MYRDGYNWAGVGAAVDEEAAMAKGLEEQGEGDKSQGREAEEGEGAVMPPGLGGVEGDLDQNSPDVR